MISEGKIFSAPYLFSEFRLRSTSMSTYVIVNIKDRIFWHMALLIHLY